MARPITCDHCGKITQYDQLGGWLRVDVQEARRITLPGDSDLDFCSWPCLESYAYERHQAEIAACQRIDRYLDPREWDHQGDPGDEHRGGR